MRMIYDLEDVVKPLKSVLQETLSAIGVALLILGAFSSQTWAAPQPQAVIEGAVNPEMIPDGHQYIILFRLLANRSGPELQAVRGFLRQIQLGQENCESCPKTAAIDPEDIQIDKILAAAQEFSDRDRLGGDRERLCDEIISSLASELGAIDAEKLRIHVQKMKRKTKVVLPH